MSEAPKRKCCDCCDGRGYHRCECWPGDCICGYGDLDCEECRGTGDANAPDPYDDIGHYDDPPARRAQDGEDG